MLSLHDRQQITDALRRAPNESDHCQTAQHLLLPLVRRPTKHYRGFSDEDYANILALSQVGARPSCREVAENRREQARAHGSLSPSKSTVYTRLTSCTEQEIAGTSSDVVLQIVGEHARLINNANVKLVMDEFDEASEAESNLTGGEAKTEVGRRIRPRKQMLALMKDAAGPLPYRAFRDQGMYGLEHMSIVAVMADGTRYCVVSFICPPGHTPNAEYAYALQRVAWKLQENGLNVTKDIVDRRWDDPESVSILKGAPAKPIVRGKISGSDPLLPLTRAGRKRLGKKRGEIPWNRKELAHQCWAKAQPVPGLPNTLAHAVHGRPYANSDLEMTMVFAYRLRRGWKLKPGEQLDLARNMTSILLLTTGEPTQETANEAVHDYLGRWVVEEDIKEHKSYVEPGSGPNTIMRSLKESVATILEALATFIHAMRRRRGARSHFVRYVYNHFIRNFSEFDGHTNGWSPYSTPAPP